MAKIELENVTVVYDNDGELTYAVNGISAVFKDGKISVIVGYSGSGKTTLLKTIAGLLQYNGNIYIDGEELAKIKSTNISIAFVSQEYILYPHMTIFDNIAFPLKNIGASKQEIITRVKEIAEILNLTCCLTRKPKHLSGGQQQRVALARALVKRPDICLFDEPLSNVDESFRREARMLIKNSIKSISATVIYVTHNISEAMILADELFVFNDGKIEIFGSPLDVYNSGNEIVNSLTRDIE